MKLGLVELKNNNKFDGKQEGLGLVDASDTDKVLVFNEVTPSVDQNQPFFKLEMISPIKD